MSASVPRRTGWTTDQMKRAPHGAIFVYAGPYHYSRALATHLGRTDLVLVAFNSNEVLRSVVGTQRQVVVDHALSLPGSDESWREWCRIIDIQSIQAQIPMKTKVPK